MVSSGESGGVVESGAGTIVWVRRRNGSWWPGRILGPQDLSSSHLMSPRSGTPVKLLGREDASVDWYNLEKSKRVKAFRCGEFDDCIERAEASQGLPVKKREKYARREDAILHALELEKQALDKKYGKSVKPKGLKENSSESERKISGTPVRALENGNGKLGNRELCQPGKKVDKSNLVEKNGGPPLVQKVKDVILPSLEDRSIILGSQLRGLQDFRLKTVPMNKMQYSTNSEDSNRTAIDGQAYGGDPCFENYSDSDSKNSIGKGKRLLDGYVEEPIPKRHHGLPPFVNIRQNSSELPNQTLQADMYSKGLSGDGTRFPAYTAAESSHMLSTKQGLHDQMEKPFSRLEVGTRPQHVTFAEEAVSGSSEETESDSSETHSIEPRVEAGMLLSDAETCRRPPSRLCDRFTMQAGQESTSSADSDELLVDDRSQFHYLDQTASGAEVSKWQLKGKRNVRNLGKRPLDKFTQRTYFDAGGRPLNQRASSHSLSYYHDNDADFSEDDLELHTHGFGQRGYSPSQTAARKQTYLGPNMIDWGRPLRGYWEETGGCISPMFMGRNGQDMLIDVDLQVQANRQGEHVPWVSLMSKLNGKAIIGHPVQVETLKEGSTDILLSTTEELGYDSDSGKVPPPPVWKTARRTAKKLPAPNSVYKGSLSKVGNSHASRSFQGTKKAPPRKRYLPSNQKTKPLSSIGLDQKVSNKTSDEDRGNAKNGGMKTVDPGTLTVACIPVKLAFSRLLEAVGRPPSGAAKHGVSVGQQ